MAAIVRALGRERVLLVLDNLEVILQPPSHPQAGRAIARDWGLLLDQLANGNHQSLTVLTSRELPTDLAGVTFGSDKPNRRRVRIERLERVVCACAVVILRDYWLQDSVSYLVWVAERVGGHPFSLELLSRHYGDRPGYLRRHGEILVQGTESLLKKQVARQSETARRLLGMLCVLRCAVDGRGLTILRLFGGDPRELDCGEREMAETEEIAEQLVRASLVQAKYDEERCEVLFSLHRVVVEFMVRRVDRGELWAAAFSYYRAVGLPKRPQVLGDLQPLLEAQHFAFQLGNYSEAENLIYELEKYLDPWGYWSLKKDLCEQLLPNLERASKPYIAQRIGIIYRDWGDWQQAESRYQQALKLAEAEDNRHMIASLQGQLGDIERYRGNWDAAEVLYRQCLEIESELGDRSGMASSNALLALCERHKGNPDRIQYHYEIAHKIYTQLGAKKNLESLERAFKA